MLGPSDLPCFLRSLYRCVWMPIFGHLKLRDLYMSLTYFDRCILTLYGIGVLQTFFCEALPPNLHCFHKLHPVTRGNLLYCQYKIHWLFVWGFCPVFVGCPLSTCDWRQTCPFCPWLGFDVEDIASMPVTFARHIWRSCRSLINIGIRRRGLQLQGGESDLKDAP